MNEDLLTPDDIRMLDRLVDGELNESERRTLLLRLEHSPDGWRRCALAFLEAQSWRLEARAMVAEPAPLPAQRPAPAPQEALQPASLSRKTWNGLSVWMPSMLAAGILVAVVYPQWDGFFHREKFVPVAQHRNPQLSAAAPATSVVAHNSENVRLPVASGPNGEKRFVDVPLVEADRMGEDFVGRIGGQLSPEVVRILEQNGNRVVREHRYVPYQLEDGRRVVVPVEQVEIRPVSNPGFQ